MDFAAPKGMRIFVAILPQMQVDDPIAAFLCAIGESAPQVVRNSRQFSHEIHRRYSEP